MLHTRANVVVLALLIGAGPVAVLVPNLVSTAAAQSVNASIFGTVYDEQHGVLPGATVTVKNLETGQVRSTTSSDTGTFRLVGLAPGRHHMTCELVGFATHVDPDIHLSLSEEIEMNVTLTLATLVQTATVVGGQTLAGSVKIALGRTITTKQIDELPVAGRDFTTLALLTPGILENHSSGLASSSGIEAAGQTGRSTGFLVDGLSLNDAQHSNVRGGISVDAIREFLVLSNGFSAEYGQAAGAVVGIVTRSGTNQLAGRASYYHRDDAWDATPAQARLVGLSKSKLGQQIVSGFLGGPLARDRLFFFGSAEETLRDTENIITSPVLSTFRPGASTHVPLHTRIPLILGRGDANLSASDSLTVRYRLSQTTVSPFFFPDLGKGAPERAVDAVVRDQDGAILSTHVWGSRGLNEFRFQFARRFFDLDPSRYCSGCPAEERPSIFLGKGAGFPSRLTEDRWQVADSVTSLRSGTHGDHALKAGVDVSVVGVDWALLPNQDGSFQFSTDRPFDPAIPATYPVQYTWTIGNPFVHEHTRLLTLFMQDEWKLRSHLTLNLGVRWDYQSAPGLSHETGKVAPRLGVAWDPWRTGKTVLRGSYGLYYDEVFLRIAHDADQAKTTVQSLLMDPGYPYPFGPNLSRSGGPVTPTPTTMRLADDLRAPYTAQAMVGIRREIGSGMSVSTDGVLARGHHLFLTHDLNYPDLSAPGHPRPDQNFLQILEVQSHGHSWYRALQVGVEKRHAHRYSFTAAYTLSSSERDTEDYTFIAQDQRDEAAERGPSLSDARHRLAASVNLELPGGLRLTAITTAQSALPYNITTGVRNPDGYVIVRPAGMGRNAARGTAFWDTDARVSKALRIKSRRLELLAEAFNLANRANWTGYDGKKTSATYGRPTSAAGSREVQLGIRFDF